MKGAKSLVLGWYMASSLRNRLIQQLKYRYNITTTILTFQNKIYCDDKSASSGISGNKFDE